ncbi:MAG: response regulator [Anaerolineaceae bacterium]|nr:response regulator [Anaerolineaceae bacterium]
MNNTLPVTILLVEDDPGHAKLIMRNLQRANVTNNVIHFLNGKDVLEFLQSETLRQTYYLMLLDLNMPVMDGYQVLEQMKNNSSTQRIPIIILTTTDDQREVNRCYDLGCNVFLTKPIDPDLFSQAIHKLGLLLSIVTIPEKEGN